MFSKLVIFFALAAVGIFASPAPNPHTDEESDIMIDAHKKCLEVSGATEDMAADAMNGYFSDEPAVKKLVLCVATKMGFITDSGEILPDIIKQKKLMFDEADKVAAAVNLCAVKKDTPEDTIFEMSRCLWKVKRGEK